MTEPLYVSFLWHMHQPYYKDPVQGGYILPWTYLHAVKDYYDMPAIVAEVPGVKVTFNLVPSLLEQLLEYAAGTATDPFLTRACLDPADLGEDDRLFIIENFFSANRQRMIEPHRRYLELYSLAGHGSQGAGKDAVKRLGDQEIMDLQVWFYLTWTGEAARRRYPLFNELIRKGRGFTAADKDLLFQTQRELIGEIIPLYQRLQREGAVELSVTPYFHPILPLLCDTRLAKVALPKATLPKAPFRYPEDARAQVARALKSFEELFGLRPQGMWPSEGSVSDEALAIMAQKGLDWSASDEWVLSRTLPGGLGREQEALYHPYSFFQEGRDIALFFRDHTLSDLIGFTYSQWETERAVADFLARLKGVRQRCHGSRVVSIIMDGENAWEYFPSNGFPFLTRLYRALTATPGLQLATFSEVLDRVPERKSLGHVHPGSWINADYAIWVGHAEKNLGWDLLAAAREAAVQKSPAVALLLSGGESDDETARLVCKSLYAAQGSDWFWWYGDDHYSAHAAGFDLLFRSHLMNVYRLLGLEVPPQLAEPIKRQLPAGFVREPSAFISPSLGEGANDYFEWLAAGLYDLTKLSSAMHASESVLQSFFYGFDDDHFYVRIDGVQSLEKLLRENDLLSLHLTHGTELRLDMKLPGGEAELLVKEAGGWRPSGLSGQYRISRIAKARLALKALKIAPGDQLLCQLTLSRDGQEVGRWPVDTPLVLSYAGDKLAALDWEI
ncbi:glycoside hydrolase family 57 protein [Geomonas sp.]|uniref:glycoside hydrolase family 57 protein n=1 Tax=Geomonas sp. TaxID=2651584 RepID=UPI002B464AD0|nr:glycoside hydrolase family 57 protein [Geomonas sp.]HJV36517.1 glycoside hydrolase family 57 protein [Geomonas sp.]